MTWYLYRKDLPDGRTIFVVHQIFTWLLTVGTGERTYAVGY